SVGVVGLLVAVASVGIIVPRADDEHGTLNYLVAWVLLCSLLLAPAGTAWTVFKLCHRPE
ncbi:hypothetical protein, partial [Nocardia seriolae]